jgi:putative endonuclease
MKTMYVYILKCSDDSFYTGVTNNADRRLAEHNYGLHKSSYTYSRRPLEIVYSEKFTNPELAIEWEKKIKGWSHRKKQALIDDDWNSLVEFSKTYKVKSYKRS